MRNTVLAWLLLLAGCTPQKDPSPYVPDGPWAHTTVAVHERTITPNLHFSFEHEGDPLPRWCSMARAHDGSHSLRLKRGEEWTPVLKRALADVADTLHAVQAGAWLWSVDADPRCALVVSIERRPGQPVAWFEKVLDESEQVQGEWIRLQAEFLMRERDLLPTDTVLIYFWNKGRRELYIDDMDVFFHSRSIPGGTQLDPDTFARLFPQLSTGTP